MTKKLSTFTAVFAALAVFCVGGLAGCQRENARASNQITDSMSEGINDPTYTYTDAGLIYRIVNRENPIPGLLIPPQEDNGIEICGYAGTPTDVVIPDTIDGQPVTSIAFPAFQNCQSLTSVSIPDSVTYIGNSVFDYCTSLTAVNIPDSVKWIDMEAFGHCRALTSIAIPNGITSLDLSTFGGCISLTSVTLPDSLTSLGDATFEVYFTDFADTAGRLDINRRVCLNIAPPSPR
ncbi:MAG: leucine-rich repeat domain-containing protein [Oscillospiraceae bacterium]|nr:leucine-rich repeat domain-containing protein [Oscillospiraceae bacterium]